MIVPLVIAGLYTLAYYFLVGNWQSALLLAVGLAIGLGFYLIDVTVLAAKYADPGTVPRPVTRSLWMLALYWPLALFVTTSTGSVIGIGLIVGLGLALTWDLLRLQSSEAGFKSYFQIPDRSQLNHLEIQTAVVIWSLAFLMLLASIVW